MFANLLFAALAATCVLVLGCAAIPSDDQAMEELALRGALSAREHEAVAAHYRRLADASRQAARRHEFMAATYRGQRGPQRRTRTEMQRHCQSIQEAHEALAAQYEEFARLHEQEATGSETTNPGELRPAPEP